MSVIGLRVGPFEITEPANVPEPGDWYRAERVGLTRKKPTRVLVRLLTPSADESERAELQRAFDRLRAVEDARVPAAVALYEGIGALAVDAPDGISFQDVIDARRAGTIALTPATLLDLAIEVAECLQHAHHRNRVHGHLAAEHLRLSTAGRLFVFGFGAGPAHPPHDAWVAPERAQGLPATDATDQWSLGAILAGMITGHDAWEDGRSAVQGDMTAPVDAVERQWPALSRLFRRMLEPDPANRFPTMHPVRQELLALARRANATSTRRELARSMALRIDRPIHPETEVAPVPDVDLSPPEAPPLPPEDPPDPPQSPLLPETASPPTPEASPTRTPPLPAPRVEVSTAMPPRDPEDPPSIPDAPRAEAPPLPRANTPLTMEPLAVVAPDVETSSLPEARRPLDPLPVPVEEEEEEDVDDAPTVRFDPMMAKELAKLANAPDPTAPSPAPITTGAPFATEKNEPDDASEVDDEETIDPQTLARALAVSPHDDPFGGMPTAVPITDVDGEDPPDVGAIAPVDDRPKSTPAPVHIVQEISAPPRETPASGPDVRKLAPLLVGLMVILMGAVVLASLR